MENRQDSFDNARVYHLDTYAANRDAGFGKTVSKRAARMDTPDMVRHENEAMAIHDKPAGKLTKGLQWLGLIE